MREKKLSVSDFKSLPLFGKTPSYKDSRVVLLGLPWSATASFGRGAEEGPLLLSKNSLQMDFFSESTGGEDIRQKGVFFHQLADLKPLSEKIRTRALPLFQMGEEAPGNFPPKTLQELNQLCTRMVEEVFCHTRFVHQSGKHPGLVGGEHSVSEGAIRYFYEVYPEELGVLHIDAHADLRKSYQGLEHSHASVMYNVLEKCPGLCALVQVGVRDYCKEEYLKIKAHKNIHTFFDAEVKARLFEGRQTFSQVAKEIIHLLPEKVYISLDVDGLQPFLFPHTGTPVPGGLSFEELNYLFSRLLESKKQIVGFDIVEVAAPQKKYTVWDAQPAARLLYRLCQMILHSSSL